MTRQERYKKRKPWVRFVEWARRRCRDSRHTYYAMYGGLGITCELTAAQAEVLWHRDNAAKLKRPSLDRIDSTKPYTYDNCAFIELSANSAKANRERWAKVKAQVARDVGPAPEPYENLSEEVPF